MTTVGPGQMQGLANISTAMAKLVVGAEVVADVIGPTRHGLTIRLGDVPYSLNMGAKLPEARHLTLKIIEGANDAGRKVQIVASDHQPLAKPVQGELISRSPILSLQTTSDTVSRGSQIDVPARLVADDGRATGPEFTVRLTTRPISSTPINDLPVAPPATSGESGVESAKRHSADLLPSRPVLTQPSSPPVLEVGAEVTKRQALPNLPADVRRSSEQPKFPLPTSPALTDLTSTHAGPKETMTATVVGRAPHGGQVLLQVADDVLLQVEQPIDLPAGTTLQMAWMALSKNTAMPASFDSPIDNANPLVKLVELLQEIEQSGHKTAEHSDQGAARRLPMPDRDLAAKLLQLINIQMRQDAGDAGGTSRDDKAVNPPKTQLIQNLLSEISDTASEPLADGWRSTTLPLGADAAQAVTVHQREHNLNHYPEDNDDETDDTKAQRAVFDITFSHLGRCQIDAYCEEERFDLLVRSERILDSTDQQQITNLFASACEIAGLKGEISYRHGQFFEPDKMPISRTTLTT